MSRTSKTPLIVTDIDHLSLIADAFIAAAGNPQLSKNTVLNIFAGSLLGKGRNWGSLKATTSPVFTRGLSLDDLVPAKESSSQEMPTWPWRLVKSGLVMSLDAHSTQVLLKPAELPIFYETFFSAQPQPVFNGIYGVFSAIEDESGPSIQLDHDRPDGTAVQARFPTQRFFDFIFLRKSEILETIVDRDIGDRLHSAFISVCEGMVDQDGLFVDLAGENEAYARIIEAETQPERDVRLDQAAKDAVWLYLATLAHDARLREAFTNGEVNTLIDDILDHQWTLISDALRQGLDAWTNI
ncbi:hypothetical protein ACOI1H_13420 [Loktanella sp. DJP18]|uniref:hypothetical protein n=1 Tax=Loktanella sp. DJP18 TaxID=3409788 RepID=UPI003BB4F5FC